MGVSFINLVVNMPLSSDEDTNNPIIPEPHEQDTGAHYNSPPKCKSQPHDELDTIPEEEEEPQMKE